MTCLYYFFQHTQNTPNFSKQDQDLSIESMVGKQFIFRSESFYFSRQAFNIIIQQSNKKMNVCFEITHHTNPQAQKPQNDSHPSPDIQSATQLLQNDIFTTKGQKERWNSKRNLYHWNKIEDRKYLNFLIKHKDLFFLSKEERKCIKINVAMSEAIKSRSPQQCHTHHQKMMQKFGNIDNIVRIFMPLVSLKSPRNFQINFSQAISNSNQGLRARQESNREFQSANGNDREPQWLQYVGLYSTGETSFLQRDSSLN